MALFKSSNPALTEKAFNGFNTATGETNIMTLQGTINKTAILLLLVIASSMYTWSLFNTTLDFSAVVPYLGFGIVGALIVAIILIIKKEWSPYLAPAYAILEGLALGGLSAALNVSYPGIVLQALLLTFGILGVLLIIYKLQIIKVTETFKLILIAATAGIGFFYLLSFILSFFHVQVPLINDATPAGIIFSLVVVVVASLNLVMDFDFIDKGIQNKVPKYMEWYGAFGIMVTLIWLYLEILRLLGKLGRR